MNRTLLRSLVPLLAAAGCAQPVEGVVQRDLCHPLEAGTVRIVGEERTAPIDAQGRYHLDGAPERVSLEVSADGFDTTRSAERAVPVAGPVFAVPAGLTAAAYQLAAVAPVKGRGSVLLRFVDAAQNPLDGVAVKVVSGPPADDGKSFGLVRYPEMVAAGEAAVARFAVDRVATAAGSGLYVIFNARPGDYRLAAEREGTTFPPVQLSVGAGVVTSDVVRGEGRGADLPVVVRGRVVGGPPWPAATGGTGPLPGASVAFVFGDTRVETTTGADGTYELPLPGAGVGLGHLAVAAPGYTRALGGQHCVGPSWANTIDVQLPDEVTGKLQVLPATAGQALRADRGTVLVHLERALATGSAPLSGGVVELVGAQGAAPYYGHLASAAQCVASGSCAGGCPAGTRCENGACLLGAAPVCSACGAGRTCPAGFEPEELPTGGGGVACSCLAGRTDCFAADQGCPEGTYCAATVSTSLDQRSITRQVCRPLGTPFTNAVYGWALFANVAPGEYLLRGTHAEGPFLSRRVRVEAGAYTAVSLVLSARASPPGEE